MTSEQFWDHLSGLSKEDKVQALAMLLMEIADIAALTGYTAEELSALIRIHPEDPISIAYNRGKLKTKVMLRFDALRYAISGSPEATKEMLQHMVEQEQSERDA